IHSVVQDDQDIRPVPSAAPGLLGTVWYHGAPVPVYDFAHRLGVSSGREAKQALIDTLMQRERDHIEWIDALETSVREGVSFTRACDPNRCAFGKWYSTFHTRDAVLSEIMAQFDEPHRRIHGLADELISMTLYGRREEALERLDLERETTFRRMRTLFSEARDQIEEMSRTVLLFLTDNGHTPRVGLRIDEIDDVVSFSASVFVPADRVSVDVRPGVREMLLGYINEGGRQAILIQPTIAFA
ncbi:MAG: CZB domain-containing protein, partial [Myxococcota bacterium]